MSDSGVRGLRRLSSDRSVFCRWPWPRGPAQRPLATVVVGGLVTATLLTLGVLPSVYAFVRAGARPDTQAPEGEADPLGGSTEASYRETPNTQLFPAYPGRNVNRPGIRGTRGRLKWKGRGRRFSRSFSSSSRPREERPSSGPWWGPYRPHRRPSRGTPRRRRRARPRQAAKRTWSRPRFASMLREGR